MPAIVDIGAGRRGDAIPTAARAALTPRPRGELSPCTFGHLGRARNKCKGAGAPELIVEPVVRIVALGSTRPTPVTTGIRVIIVALAIAPLDCRGEPLMLAEFALISVVPPLATIGRGDCMDTVCCC